MRDAAVGFPLLSDCVKAANKGSRQNKAMHGGERSTDPRLTSYVLIASTPSRGSPITATGGGSCTTRQPVLVVAERTCELHRRLGRYTRT